MKTEYRVFDPSKGIYTNYVNLEEATTAAKSKAWEFYCYHCNGKALSKVIITDEGAEIWGEA